MKRALLFYSAFIFGLGGILVVSIALGMPQGSSGWLWASLGVYELMEIGIAFLLGRYERVKDTNSQAAKHLMQYYMLTKLGKLLVTMVLIGLGAWQIGAENRPAVLSLAAMCVILYLAYLMAETIVLTKKK